MGGVLFEGDSPVAFFSSMLTKDDEKIHHHRIGEHEGQQLWECLSVLVALKAWLHFWSQRRISVAIRSDNLSALYMAARMKSKASPLINRNIALVYSRASFEPRFVEHIPGVANSLADGLSRLYEPDSHYVLPEALSELTPTPLPRRNRSYYDSLSAAQVGKKGKGKRKSYM